MNEIERKLLIWPGLFVELDKKLFLSDGFVKIWYSDWLILQELVFLHQMAINIEKHDFLLQFKVAKRSYFVPLQ